MNRNVRNNNVRMFLLIVAKTARCGSGTAQAQMFHIIGGVGLVVFSWLVSFQCAVHKVQKLVVAKNVFTNRRLQDNLDALLSSLHLATF